jgi:phosphopentomutase
MTDLVERLQKAILYDINGKLSDLTEEAADEIERLTAALAVAETAVDLWRTRCAGAVSLIPDEKLTAELKEAMNAVVVGTWNAAIEAVVSRHQNEIERLQRTIQSNAEYMQRTGSGDFTSINLCETRLDNHVREIIAIRSLRKETP